MHGVDGICDPSSPSLALGGSGNSAGQHRQAANNRGGLAEEQATAGRLYDDNPLGYLLTWGHCCALDHIADLKGA
jgi:hypothetical protein